MSWVTMIDLILEKLLGKP